MLKHIATYFLVISATYVFTTGFAYGGVDGRRGIPDQKDIEIRSRPMVGLEANVRSFRTEDTFDSRVIKVFRQEMVSMKRRGDGIAYYWCLKRINEIATKDNKNIDAALEAMEDMVGYYRVEALPYRKSVIDQLIK